jgi:hypothetical protein
MHSMVILISLFLSVVKVSRLNKYCRYLPYPSLFDIYRAPRRHDAVEKHYVGCGDSI